MTLASLRTAVSLFELNRIPLTRPDMPVTPDDGEARSWLSDELSKTVYQDAKPGLLERLLTTIGQWLADVLRNVTAVDPDLGVVLIGFGAIAVILLAVWLIRPRRNARTRELPGIFDGTTVHTAAEHRAHAAAAAGNGRYDDGLTEILRAVIVSAEERGVLDPAPGRTADEVSALLQSVFPGRRSGIGWLTSRFNEVRYGNGSAGAGDYGRAAALEEALQGEHPQRHRGTSPPLTVPA